MESWKNGAQGSEVKRIINNNFDILDKKIIGINGKISNLEPTGITFVSSTWVYVESSKTYAIFIPYSSYNKANPSVEVYIKNGDGYSPVRGGYKIKEYGVELQSDLAYEGKVVIR